MGSTRALACFDRRRAGRKGRVEPLPGGKLSDRTNVVGEGADHRTRGRVRSSSRSNSYR